MNNQLFCLHMRRKLESTPVLIIANKVLFFLTTVRPPGSRVVYFDFIYPQIDLLPHISETEMVQELNLDYIHENPW